MRFMTKSSSHYLSCLLKYTHNLFILASVLRTKWQIISSHQLSLSTFIGIIVISQIRLALNSGKSIVLISTSLAEFFHENPDRKLSTTCDKVMFVETFQVKLIYDINLSSRQENRHFRWFCQMLADWFFCSLLVWKESTLKNPRKIHVQALDTWDAQSTWQRVFRE